jgi:uncharacterized protein YgiM (DUF1202 family)
MEAVMSKFPLVISVLCIAVTIPLFVSAQDGDAKVGVLTGDKVRVRTGAGTSHKILIELAEGSKVLVVSKKEAWYEIEMPRDIILWINKSYVKEYKEGSLTMGDVTGDKVNVRTGTEATDVVVGQVSNGDKLVIVGGKEGWYKIQPPKGFTAYIFARFVKVDDEAGVATHPGNGGNTNPPDGPEDDYQRRLRELREQIDKLSKEAQTLEELLEQEKEKERELEEKLRKAEEISKRLEDSKKEIDRQLQEALERIRTGEKPKPKYTAEGYVDDIGRRINPPPATHCLYITGGDEPRYYLKSAHESINLDNYLRKRVGLTGKIVKEKWGDKEIEVIKVESIAILED